MIIVALFFGSLLAVFYHSTSERISEQRRLRLQKAVLSVFELPEDNVEEDYERYISEHEFEGMQYYIARDDTLTLGYCFAVSGSGLWGTITALLAVNEEFEQILALHILDQNETPGLGGRISEESFLEQFAGQGFIEDDRVVEFSLVPEDETAGRHEINQITGATSSSRAVVSIVYDNLQKIRNIPEARL